MRSYSACLSLTYFTEHSAFRVRWVVTNSRVSLSPTAEDHSSHVGAPTSRAFRGTALQSPRFSYWEQRRCGRGDVDAALLWTWRCGCFSELVLSLPVAVLPEAALLGPRAALLLTCGRSFTLSSVVAAPIPPTLHGGIFSTPTSALSLRAP